MKQVISKVNETQSASINRAAYILYLVLVLYQWIIGDYYWAVTNMGIALIFDPFSSVTWPNRTNFQKGVLLLHLTLLAGGAAFLVFN